MDLTDAASTIRLVWQYKPEIIWLLVLGSAVFLFVVVDTWSHKRRRRRREPPHRH